jgi:Rrf2 family protein
MQISKGVEWAVHALSLMTALPEKRGLSAEALAHYHHVPPAYMAKQMQALSRAGIVVSSRGTGGGYRLAKLPIDINLWDITAAIEGSTPAFRCTEIRQNGPCGVRAEDCKAPCAIASAFLRAETAYRSALRLVSLADIGIEVMSEAPQHHLAEILTWIDTTATSNTTL